MRWLRFKRDHVLKVKAGEKDVTRRWWKAQWLKPGDICRAVQGDRYHPKPFGYVRIVSVTPADRKLPEGADLNTEAAREGYSGWTWATFWLWFRDNFPQPSPDHRLYRVEFTYAETEDELRGGPDAGREDRPPAGRGL